LRLTEAAPSKVHLYRRWPEFPFPEREVVVLTVDQNAGEIDKTCPIQHARTDEAPLAHPVRDRALNGMCHPPR
jgi:hypothetical protein